LSDSPYGTFDQTGNVYEWNEAVIGSNRGIRGGGWGGGVKPAAERFNEVPTAERGDVGLRVAAAPPLQSYPVTIALTLIDHPGNAADTTGQPNPCGAVAYRYRIGTYEVSAGQYTEFLNAVASNDTYSLYSTLMLSAANGCKIQQNGASGSYWYTVPSNCVDRPVGHVSWGDAARFANWLHNRKPTGAQSLATTEDGAYYLNGANDDIALSAVTRKAGAIWWIPSESEWYKAAYHKNDGATGNYWDYPTGSDTAPTATSGGTAAGTTVFNQTLPADVDFCGGLSPYGTMGQGGNVYEWNEANTGTKRNRRGGSFGGSTAAAQKVDVRYDELPTFQQSDVGFRVAAPPPWGTVIKVQ
jgi:formylglycine-generating enzyme required for sulfatase activity